MMSGYCKINYANYLMEKVYGKMYICIEKCDNRIIFAPHVMASLNLTQMVFFYLFTKCFAQTLIDLRWLSESGILINFEMIII